MFEGVYCWFFGFSFEILVEICVVCVLGVDVVGMFMVLEVILLCFLGLCCVVVLVIINMGVGLLDEFISYDYIKVMVFLGVVLFEKVLWWFLCG